MPEMTLNSEVGRLRGVVLHRPGVEIERMTPATIHEALYSDLLGRETARREYTQLEDFLSRVTKTYCFDDLLAETLGDAEVRRTCLSHPVFEGLPEAEKTFMQGLGAVELSRYLIEGAARIDDPQRRWRPLYNLYFTRDIGVRFNDRSMPTKMSTAVRAPEAVLTGLIYRYHPLFATRTRWADPWADSPAAALEGGDFLVADRDIFLIGQGARSNAEGVRQFIKTRAAVSPEFHVLTQELPHEPESFIHLDMVFTLLSRHHCMVYKPLLDGRLKTRLLTVRDGEVREEAVPDLLAGLERLGKSYEPVFCGGGDALYQERDQWHSGANFFAVAPGHILGYGRNSHTIDALAAAGFEVKPVQACLDGRVPFDVDDEAHRVVYTIESAELVRGGGGCRCMTMPVDRDAL
ncbi:MAG: arginine deiminase [Bacteroidales bacterium]|nr:arginine deiminase [Bacteroidales bacterium]